MAYVPQFVQTDLSVLQGIMDKKDAKYDYNTARGEQMGDFLSQLDATRPYDVQKKEQFRNQLSTAISDLDKRYNFDRSSSQYADDLTKVISGMKSDSYWPFKKKADEVAATRQKLMQEKGIMYGENYNPFDQSLTEKNMGALDSWKSFDKKDIISMASFAGKGLSLDIKRRYKSTPHPGMIEFTDGVGFTDTQSAIQFLLEDPNGMSRVDQTIQSLGLDPSNQEIRGLVIESMADNMVGKDDRQRMWIPQPAQGNNRDDVGIPTSPWGEISMNTSQYAAKNLGDIHKLEEGITTTTEAIDHAKMEANKFRVFKAEEKKLAAENKIEELQLQKLNMEIAQSKVKTLRDRHEKFTSYGTGAQKSGENLLLFYYPNIPKGDRDAMQNELLNIFIDTNAAQRSGALLGMLDIGAALANATNTVLTAAKRRPGPEDLVAATADALNQSVKGSNEWDMVSSMLKRQLQEIEDKYGDDPNMEAAKQDEMKNTMSTFGEMLTEFRDYYKGFKNYAPGARPSYAIVESKINEDLEAGPQYNYVESSPSPEADPANVKQAKDWIFDNLNRFEPIESEYKKGPQGMWEEGKFKNFYQKINDDRAGTRIKLLTNPEDPALISIIAPDDERITVRINENKSGYKVVQALQNIFPYNPEITNQYFSSVDFVEGDRLPVTTYKDSWGRYFLNENNKVDMTKIAKYEIEDRVAPNGTHTYYLYKDSQDKNPIAFGNKIALMMTLIEKNYGK